MNSPDLRNLWLTITKRTLARAIRTADFELSHQMADILLAIHPHDQGDATNSPIALAANLAHAHALQCLLDEGEGQWSFLCIGQSLASAVPPDDSACFYIAKNAIAKFSPTPEELSRALHDALCEAANLGKLPLVLDLLATGAPTEPANTHGSFSPLAIAAEYGHVDCLRALAKSGAVVDYDTGNGWTPIARAIKNNQIETVRALIALGAHLSPRYNIPHSFDFHGENPLVHWADAMSSHQECPDILMALLQAGAPFNLSAPKSKSYRNVLLAQTEQLLLEDASPRPAAEAVKRFPL